jgi:hypothetical protein
MRQHAIPLLWDHGVVGSANTDGGVLRLRKAIDPAMEHELELTKGELALPTLAIPTHQSPSIDPEDVQSLLEELKH